MCFTIEYGGFAPPSHTTVRAVRHTAVQFHKSREKLLTIKGNHDGYDVIFKDGRTVHCRTKLEIRRCLAHDNKSLTQDT